MAEHVIFRVDVDALSSIADTLTNIMDTYSQATETASGLQDVSVTGSTDVSDRLDEFFREARKGQDKFGEEIEKMITTLATITTAYDSVESSVTTAFDQS